MFNPFQSQLKLSYMAKVVAFKKAGFLLFEVYQFKPSRHGYGELAGCPWA